MSADMKIKTAAGKPDLALIPLSALHGVARVFGYGAKKYEKNNWKLATDKQAVDRYKSATLRHLSAMEDGPMALDEESGLPHLDHALCSLIMLRGLLNIHHGAQVDPGEGKDPPNRVSAKVAELLGQERERGNVAFRTRGGQTCGCLGCESARQMGYL